MLGNNLIALVVTLALSLLFLRLMDTLAHRGIISSPMSRKIIHIGTGPIFVLCWLLFTDQPSSRYLAALVPLGITLQFFLVGIGVIRDEAAVAGMARHGDRREILRGPLFYGLMFVVLTVVYWLDSPIGIVALMILCGGDGLADIIGKRVPSKSLPWSPRKTLAGTITVFLGGFLFSALIFRVFALTTIAARTISSSSAGPTPTAWLKIRFRDNFALSLKEIRRSAKIPNPVLIP